jgi:Cellulose binding domain
MGNPGRRRRSGHHRWLQALIHRGRPSEEATAGLLAEPAEFDWTGHSDIERPSADAAESWPADPAAYQWLGDWTDEPAPHRLLDGPPEAGWPAEPAASTRFAEHGTGPGLHERRRASRPGWLGRATQQDWYLALARYRWYLAVSAGAGAMALASGVILLLPHQSGRAIMADARVPRTTRGRPASTAPSQPVASPSPDVRARPTPAASPPVASTRAPTQSATVPVATTPASSAPGFVTVTFRLVQRWSGGIIGRYTIANESNAVLSGWQFTATFPGNQVQFVIGAADPDLGSDVLVLEPASAGAQLAPGGRVSAIFFAAGQTASPASCSFNGTAC